MVSETSLMYSVLKWLLGIAAVAITGAVGWICTEVRILRKRINMLEKDYVSESNVREIVHEAVEPIKESNHRIEGTVTGIFKTLNDLKTKTAVLEDRSGRQ